MTSFAILGLTFAIVILSRFLLPQVQRTIRKWKAVLYIGCREPPRYHHKDPLGRDLFRRTIEAYKEHKFLDFTERLFQEHGNTFKTITEGKVLIKTRDPEVSKAVYTTFFDKFGLQPIRYEGGKGFFGDGILVTDGAQWKRSRTLIRPAFDIAHIANFNRLDRHVSRFLEILPQDGSTIDLLPLFKRLVSASNAKESVQ